MIFFFFIHALASCVTGCEAHSSTQKPLNKNLDKSRMLTQANGHHLASANGAYGDYLSHRPGFLSVTLDSEIKPFDGKITRGQEVIFQKGMREFVQNMIENEANIKNLNVESCIIIQNDRTEDATNVLRLQSVLSAQPNEDPSGKTATIISEAKFGEIVVNLLNVFDDKLIHVWQAHELERSSAGEEIEMKYSSVEEVSMNISKLQVTTEKKVVGLVTILILSGISGLLLFTLLRALLKKREKASLNEYTEEISKFNNSQHNLQEIIKRQHDDVSFAPYGDAQQKPPRRPQNNKYSKIVLSNKNRDDQEYGLVSLQASQSAESFEDHDTVQSDLSSVSSMMNGQCFAPPGKLGVAIDTINGKAVVHRVRDGSPLAGVLRRLDVIIAVDEVDTTSMTAADVTSLMAKRMGSSRTISYLRGKQVEKTLKE